MELPDYRLKTIVPVVNSGMGGGAFQMVCYGVNAELIERNDTRRAITARLRARGFGTDWKIVWDAVHAESLDYKRLGYPGRRPARYNY